MQNLILKKLKVLPVLLLLISCAATVQQKQLDTIQLLQRIDELQSTVIDLYGSHLINKDVAVKTVTFTVNATKVIKELPNGWQSMVKAEWNQIKPLLIEPKLQLIAAALDVLIQGL